MEPKVATRGESLSRSCSGVRGACGHIAIEACKSGVHHRSVSQSGRLFLEMREMADSSVRPTFIRLT